MPQPYEELIENELTLRVPPRLTHESICAFLHRRIAPIVASLSSTQLLPMRERVTIDAENRFRPDLALITQATSKLWLAAEVINQEDHHTDTVLKKSVYETIKIPRLWMIDPRYENVEIYHATNYGLVLRETWAVKDTLVDALLPGLEIPLKELFAAAFQPPESTKRDF